MTIKITMCAPGQAQDAASEYVFAQEMITFGRAPDNVLVIPDEEKQVSSHHGLLEKRRGEWYALDLDSTNGTQLNDQHLEPRDGRLLRDGDVVTVGDFELRFEVMALPAGADQTMVHFDPDRIVDKLVEQLTVTYAAQLDDTPAVRGGAMGQVVRGALRDLLPEQSRAVLTMLKTRMAEGEGTPAEAVVDRREELYRAGHGILNSLSTTYVDDEPFHRPEDAGRFGQLVNQTLQITMEWLAKCLLGRREFETQFGADVTMMFSLEGNPLKGGQDAEEIGRYLLDWRGGRDLSRVRTDLEGAFRDLTMHQLGLLAGAQEAVKAVLLRLDPAGIEEMASNKAGWLSVLPGSSKEWDYYKQAHKELLEEKTRLYEELISPNIRSGYLAAHEKHLSDAEPRDGGGAETPS